MKCSVLVNKREANHFLTKMFSCGKLNENPIQWS